MKFLAAARDLGSVLLALLMLSSAFAAPAAAQDGPSGVWEGAIEVPGQALQVIVTLRSGGDGAWVGTIDIPAQNLADFPLSEVVAGAESVTFAMSGIPGDPVFSGTWDATAQTISGDFRQGGGVFPFTLTRTGDAAATETASTDPETAARVAGTWSGMLNAGGQDLRLIFYIEADGGSLSGTMDSPDQGQTGMPISAVVFDGTILRVDLSYAQAFFEGALSADGTTIDGSWNQGGGSLPLMLQKQ